MYMYIRINANQVLHTFYNKTKCSKKEICQTTIGISNIEIPRKQGFVFLILLL